MKHEQAHGGNREKRMMEDSLVRKPGRPAPVRSLENFFHDQ